MNTESAGSRDLRTYARILWRWKWLFLAFVIAFPIGAYLLEHGKTKTYQSSTLISLESSSIDPSTGLLTTAPDSNILVVARLITTTGVAEGANAFLKPPGDPGALIGEISVAPDQTTGFITITAQDSSPQRAAAIANAFAAALNVDRRNTELGLIRTSIDALTKQRDAFPANDQADRAPIEQQIAHLQALRSAQTPNVQVIEPATPSSIPVGTSTRRAVELALVIGLLLGIGAVLLAENSDRRIRTPDDLEDLLGIPLLSAIPRSAFAPGPLTEPREAEAFQMLRSSLTYFNVERTLSSVAIISPGGEDGKTMVAAGLAIAVARAGKRAVLLDADLRKPQICARLGLTPTEGLGAVLTGERSLQDVLLNYRPDGPEGGQVLVLPAGPPPPNPSALVSSPRMREVLRQLEESADLVIVDTPAALAVGDALPLVQATSGSVIVVRMNRSSRAAVRRLKKIVGSARATILGAVATGGGSPEGYDNYGYYVDENSSNGVHRPKKQRRPRILRMGSGRRAEWELVPRVRANSPHEPTGS